MSSNVMGITDQDGDSPDWIEIHNPRNSSIDLEGYALSNGSSGRWFFPQVDLPAGGFLIVFASEKGRSGRAVAPTPPNSAAELHTHFEISSEGDELRLFGPGGRVLDRIETGTLYVDMSRGRSPDDPDDWLLFLEPTPGATNRDGRAALAPKPEFSSPGGLFESPLLVEISTASDGEIFYTLDGTEPSATSLAYTTPIPLASTTVVRARTFRTGDHPSRIETQSYFIAEETTLPIVSIAIDPDYLWSDGEGIYVLGPNANPEHPHYGANFWKDWERPAHVEFFETDGDPGFRLDLGVKIHGGYTRIGPQKSLRLVARGGYGVGSIEYELFQEKEIDSFERLILRNGGNDWYSAYLRDPIQHRIAADTDLDRQAHQPAIVYLNGEYWGIHNIRERIDRFYCAANHDLGGGDIDLLKNNRLVSEGDADHYDQMLQYLRENDIALDRHYDVISRMMDTGNYADYFIFRTFCGNTDWPGNNLLYWRPKTPDGRWRWVLQDTDYGLNLYGVDHTFDSIDYVLDPEGGGPRPPWSTYLLRRLLENETFRNSFINRYADHLNSSFLPERTIGITEELATQIEKEIPRHMERWDRPSHSWWRRQVDVIQDYFEVRPAYLRTFLMDGFGLADTLTLSLDVVPPGTGSIELTAIDADTSWTGIYFQDVPISLTARPKPGFRFIGWSDPTLPTKPHVSIVPEGDYRVEALFTEELPVSVVINEINYHSPDSPNPEDWIELYNHGKGTVDLSGWVLEDETDSFLIPPGTSLDPGGFVVLCQDTTAFRQVFSRIGPIIGDLAFGFSAAGERIRLLDSSYEIHDEVHYDDEAPWQTAADGEGSTLELIDPALDNSLAESWTASAGLGTPGLAFVDPIAPAPSVDGSLRSYPNPFRSQVSVSFDLSQASQVQLSIHDPAGRRVRTLWNGEHESGPGALVWMGENDAGRQVATGLYFVRLRVDGAAQTIRMIRIE